MTHKWVLFVVYCDVNFHTALKKNLAKQDFKDNYNINLLKLADLNLHLGQDNNPTSMLWHFHKWELHIRHTKNFSVHWAHLYCFLCSLSWQFSWIILISSLANFNSQPLKEHLKICIWKKMCVIMNKCTYLIFLEALYCFMTKLMSISVKDFAFGVVSVCSGFCVFLLSPLNSDKFTKLCF